MKGRTYLISDENFVYDEASETFYTEEELKSKKKQAVKEFALRKSEEKLI